MCQACSLLVYLHSPKSLGNQTNAASMCKRARTHARVCVCVCVRLKI